MNGTAVYIVAAVIIVVVVVALLSYLTARQLRRHEAQRPPHATRRKPSNERTAPNAAPDDAATVLDQTTAAPDDAATVSDLTTAAPGDAMTVSDQTTAALQSGTDLDQTSEQADWSATEALSNVAAAESAKRTGMNQDAVGEDPEDGVVGHTDEEQIIGLSAYGPDGSGWDEVLGRQRRLDVMDGGDADSDDVSRKEATEPNGRQTDDPAMEPNGRRTDGGQTDGARTVNLQSDSVHFPGQLAPDDFHALLRRRLQHPAVLGWLVIAADGQFRDGDQVYDDRVLELLHTLAANARETAATVGLTAPREVVIRGSEGVICVVSANQIEAGRTESVVVFVEQGGMSPGEVARRLCAQNEEPVDGATTG